MKWLLIGLVATVAAVAVWADAPVQPLPLSAQADLLVVEKGRRQLIAYSHGEVLRTYSVSLGGGRVVRRPVKAMAAHPRAPVSHRTSQPVE
jgi:hypothetical protein